MNQRRGHVDAVSLEVIRHAISSVAEEMNANLVRSAYSPNIKERRDCSSAVFTVQGEMIAQAESIPVHLGAMPYSVAAVIAQLPALSAGDVVVVNDPYSGGAHLPDLTFVAPVYLEGLHIGYVANRAHHADVGGKEPGSLCGDSEEIFQEGLRIPPVRLWRGGELDRDLLEMILANVRTPEERWGDLRAQKASCLTGADRWLDLCRRIGYRELALGMEELLLYSERRMQQALCLLPQGTVSFEDALDDDGITGEEIPICVRIQTQGERIVLDFEGTASQVAGPVNAVFAVTASAVYFAVRAFTDPEIPANAGCYRPIQIITTEGSLVDATCPAPVVGGNLETSQRIVDVVLGALGRLAPDRAIAACQGTMNNLAIGGIDPSGQKPFALYETIGGGFGARRDRDGIDGVHSHMTNTLNTPVESLESSYPLRVECYELVPGTGGEGRYRGGLGIRRDLTCLAPSARASFLTERRTTRPYGVAGGEAGAVGKNVVIRDGQEHLLPSKGVTRLGRGDTISLRTPGGGGYGPAQDRPISLQKRDRREGRV